MAKKVNRWRNLETKVKFRINQAPSKTLSFMMLFKDPIKSNKIVSKTATAQI
jgi:hypothetical protein